MRNREQSAETGDAETPTCLKLPETARKTKLWTSMGSFTNPSLPFRRMGFCLGGDSLQRQTML